MYIPAKNVFITSGDVIFCEHVGRTEPERLLAPKVTLRESDQPCRPEDFSYLVDTIHMDNDEGVRYKVVRVYTHKGLVVVDRVLYDPEHRDVSESPIDTVHLKEVLNYPILEGAQNPNYQVPAPMSLEVPPPGTSSNDGVNTDSRTTGEGVPLVVQESARQKAKRLRDEAQQAAEIRRIEAGFRRSKRVSAKINLCASDWKLRYANTIYQWFIDQIPDDLYEPTDIVPAEQSHTGDTLSAEVSTMQTSRIYKSEPRNHQEAMGRLSEKAAWEESENRELGALYEMKFAVVCDIPLDRVLLPVIWVYKYKTDQNNNVVLYKSRLCVRGDKAVKGFDFFETFSPVAKIDSIRLVLSIIVLHKFVPVQLDIMNAYVQSLLRESVYIGKIPGVDLPPGKCYRLLRSLYGLPQSGRNWNSDISNFITQAGWIQLREDQCVYALFDEGKLVAVTTLYVDDFLFGFDSLERQNWFVNLICTKFKTKVIGLPTNIIGLCIQWEPIPNQIYFSKVNISNIKSVKVLLEKFNITSKRVVNLPYNESVTLSKDQCPTGSQLNDHELLHMQRDFRTLVGTFIWLQGTTRVDILQTVLVLSQFVANPAYQHYKAAIRLLRYLQGTIDLGIEYSLSGSNKLEGYVDADHASHESRRSVYSYIFMLAGGPIYWKNGFETRFSLSTAESEIRAVFALRECVKHLLYLKKVLKSFLKEDAANHVSLAMSKLPLAIFEDNSATIRYQQNLSSQSSMKYLEVDIYWINDSYMRKEFELVKIESCDQLADINTKFTTGLTFLSLRNRLMKIFVV